MKVTDEHVHDSKALSELVENIIKSDSMETAIIGKLFGDGAYEGNDIFRYLADKGIQPCIKAIIKLFANNYARSIVFLLDKRCISCLVYLFVISS